MSSTPAERTVRVSGVGRSASNPQGLQNVTVNTGRRAQARAAAARAAGSQTTPENAARIRRITAEERRRTR